MSGLGNRHLTGGLPYSEEGQGTAALPYNRVGTVRSRAVDQSGTHIASGKHGDFVVGSLRIFSLWSTLREEGLSVVRLGRSVDRLTGSWEPLNSGARCFPPFYAGSWQSGVAWAGAAGGSSEFWVPQSPRLLVESDGGGAELGGQNRIQSTTGRAITLSPAQSQLPISWRHCYQYAGP